MTQDSGGVSRRGLLAAVGGAGVGGVAGVVYFGDVLGGGGGGGGDGPTEITAQAPNDDGEASLEELRYLLESVEEREYTLDVTGFTYDDGVAGLTYRSGAREQSGYDRWLYHRNELGHVAWSYGRYVAANDPNLDWPPEGGAGMSTTESTTEEPTTARTLSPDQVDGGRARRLFATIENPYSVETESDTVPQPTEYGVEQHWAGNWVAGNWTSLKLIRTIANSRVQSDGGA
jgi:hypothetical protein